MVDLHAIKQTFPCAKLWQDCSQQRYMKASLKQPTALHQHQVGQAACIPSALVTIVGLPPSMAATAEFVVPKSIPTTYKQYSLSMSAT
jgi:hypothetical protein